MRWLGRLLSRKFFRRPVFVIGGGRSGTSVLVQALGKHPEIIASSNEAVFLTSIAAAAEDIAEERGRDVSFFDASLGSSFGYLEDALRRIVFESVFGEEFGLRRVAKIALEQKTFLHKRIWCAKTFPSARVAKGLVQLYPEAQFVYILRNGCDVVHSRTKFGGFRQHEFDEQCRAWTNAVHAFRFAMEDSKVLVVRQEQLVDDPASFFTGIFQFIGVKPSPAPVRFVSTTLVHPLDERDYSDVDVKKALKDRAPGYASWTNEQKAVFKAICGEAMRIAGYDMPF